jgi:CRP/FNR family transcriptional regulator, cyclic AMP receptor protein
MSRLPAPWREATRETGMPGAMALIQPVSASSPGQTVRMGRTRVLEEDRDLCEAVAGPRRLRAVEAGVATVVRRPTGLWNAREDAALAHGGFGLLVLDGILVRRVGVNGRHGAELLAKGDLLRPWEHDGSDGVMPFESDWRVVSATRLAILDLRWAAHMAPFPEVSGRLMGRVMLRSRRLAMLMAIVQQPRLDERLCLLFWELADRYGIVHPDGVHLRLPLTHEVISHLAAAQRPSVSAALGRLAQRGVLRRENRVWILAGDPPEQPLGDQSG